MLHRYHLKLERCLPALIVGIARHIYNLKSPNDLNEEIREKIFESMAEYISKFSDTNKEQVINEIEEILKRGKII